MILDIFLVILIIALIPLFLQSISLIGYGIWSLLKGIGNLLECIACQIDPLPWYKKIPVLLLISFVVITIGIAITS